MSAPTFSVHSTPVGEVLLVATDDGLVAAETLHAPVHIALSRLAPALGAMPEPDGRATAEAGRRLDEYFDGSGRDVDVRLDWRLVRGFARTALQAVRRIPYGETASYGEVAVAAGSPRAHRAVGTACARTPFSIVVPVHRVVRADGSLGEYGGHPEVKRFLLDLERAAGE